MLSREPSNPDCGLHLHVVDGYGVHRRVGGAAEMMTSLDEQMETSRKRPSSRQDSDFDTRPRSPAARHG